MCMCSAGDSAAAPVLSFSPRSQSGYHVGILFGLDTIPHPPQIYQSCDYIEIVIVLFWGAHIPLAHQCIFLDVAYDMFYNYSDAGDLGVVVAILPCQSSCLGVLSRIALYHDTRLGSRIVLLDTLVSHIVDVYGTLVFWGVWISCRIIYGTQIRRVLPV